MDTYGQELGVSMAQVAMRAGHEPVMAGKHYTGRVSQPHRELPTALSQLLRGVSEGVEELGHSSSRGGRHQHGRSRVR